MSTIYSKRLFSGANFTGAPNATVPALKVWVVKDVAAICVAPGTGSTLAISVPGGIPITWFATTGSTPNQTFRWQGMQVLYAGELLVANAITGAWYCVISGYELSS